MAGQRSARNHRRPLIVAVMLGLVGAVVSTVFVVARAVPDGTDRTVTAGERDSGSRIVATLAIRPGLEVDVWSSNHTRPVPVVVMEHSCCGDRADLGKLAEAIASAGALVFNADWAGIKEFSRYPQAYRDVACALALARQKAPAYGGDPHRVALLGWGDGGLAAAAVSERPGDYADTSCVAQTGDLRPPDALVGVAGFYGWAWPVAPALVNARTRAFLGGSPRVATAAWRAATPYGYLGQYRVRCTTLLVGVRDALVADARRFAAALRDTRSHVRLVIAPYAGDQSMISPRTREGRTTVMDTLSSFDCAETRPR